MSLRKKAKTAKRIEQFNRLFNTETPIHTAEVEAYVKVQAKNLSTALKRQAIITALKKQASWQGNR